MSRPTDWLPAGQRARLDREASSQARRRRRRLIAAAAAKRPRPRHRRFQCERLLLAAMPNQAQAPDGSRWRCSCGKMYVHVVDEATGSSWERLG